MAYFDKYGVRYSDDRKMLESSPDDFEGKYVIPYGVAYIGYSPRFFRKRNSPLSYVQVIENMQKLAFLDCEGLTEIRLPQSIRGIGTYAFAGCYNLTRIHIPKHVRFIAKDAFYGAGLERITVDPENKIYDSREDCNAIIETATNTLVRGCANTVIPSSVTRIGDWAFSGSGLTEITIPDTITSIGFRAFECCIALQTVNLPNTIQQIGESTFANNYALTTITLPKDLTDIGFWAFENCTALQRIIIPSGHRNRFLQMGLQNFEDKLVEEPSV